MAGDDIAALHDDLDRLGYSIPPIERSDHIFGVGTAAAVAHFQRGHGLWDTAVVDTHTAGMLDRAIEEAALPTLAVQVPDGEPPRPAPTPAAVTPAAVTPAAVTPAAVADEDPTGINVLAPVAAVPAPEPVEEPTFVPRAAPAQPPAPTPEPPAPAAEHFEEPTLIPRATPAPEPPVEEPTFVPRTAPVERTRPYQVAVCGPADCSDVERDLAYHVGLLLARDGAIVICGGGGGVMAGAAAGARAGGGLVIGITPHDGTRTPNPDLSAVIVTNLGEARNAVIVSSADAVIAIGGSWGTLSEVALAGRRGIPVTCLGGWRVLDAGGAVVPGIEHADTPEAAVHRALAPRR